MTTSPAAALKKELTKTFPNTKFSVKTKNFHVYVEWTLSIGVNVTNAAVQEICKKHETVVHHGSLIDDTAYSIGYSIWTYPRHSQERKDWAVEGTKAHNFVGAAWNEKWQRFDDIDGREAFHATKQYHEYCSNGVSCALVDEYGREPSTKQWYYQRLAKETQVETTELEPETIEPELAELAKETITPVSVHPIEHPVFIQSNFPAQNKQDWLENYQSQPLNLGQAKIVKIVEVTPVDYQKFIYALLDKHEWLEGEGGGSSHYQSDKYRNDYDNLFRDENETQKSRNEYYEFAVVVTNGKDYILVNPEGSGYARYAGFGVDATLSEILNNAQIQLSNCFVAPIVHAQLETNLIPFPTVKQSEQFITQLQDKSDDSFYLQSYQKWVDKLVARAEYGKIKSFDEWYAIAIEVM